MVSLEIYHSQIKPKLGWVIIAVLGIVPVLSWLSLQPISNRFASSYGLFNALGQVLGLVGIVLYAFNLILATRMRVLEDYFGGLNKAYIAHHIIGGLALVALLFHPLFLALRYVDHQNLATLHTAAIFLLPRSPAIHLPPSAGMLQDWSINDAIIAYIGLVVLLILTFFVKLPYRLWLFTHKFLGAAFFFAGLHVLWISSDVSRNQFLRYYILLIVIMGLIAAIYRSLLGRILIRTYNYHVDEVNKVGVDVVELIMRPVGRQIDFQPGQFVFIRFRYSGDSNITTEAHPFSISSAPGDDFLRLSVKALGDYTKSLLNLKPGAIAEIEGAFGRFSYQNFSNPNQIWVAGGIGITPFLSMARSLTAHGPQVDLFYSVKTSAEFVDFETLSKLVGLHSKQFRLIPFISDKQGLLTADFIDQESGGLSGKDIFLCGPPPMMKALRLQLRSKGVAKRMIHSEEFAIQ